jgi:ATP synthase protein I
MAAVFTHPHFLLEFIYLPHCRTALTCRAGLYRFRADLAGPLAWTLGLARKRRRPQPFMSEPSEDSQEALKRLQNRLDTLTAERTPKGSDAGTAERGVGEGYRLLGEVIGGVLGGLGLGWLFDSVAHTTPFGVVIGMLAGTAAAGYAAVKSAGTPAAESQRKED